MTTQFFSAQRNFNADLYKPIEMYLGLRTSSQTSCLLESNELSGRENSRSILGFDPMVEIYIQDNEISIHFQNREVRMALDSSQPFSDSLHSVFQLFKPQDNVEGNGFFGRLGFEMAHQVEGFSGNFNSQEGIPDAHFFLFKYVVLFDHFFEAGTLIKNSWDGAGFTEDELNRFLLKKPIVDLPFETVGQEMEEGDSSTFISNVDKVKQHLKQGDVFQLVLSQSYKQAFFGDDFLVYRQMRRSNPSPYLFYFDFGRYKIFGSSPEAQLRLNNSLVEIHPIAGTIARTGATEEDAVRSSQLLTDGKENAEHDMLVDLARNDLSRVCDQVKVKDYKSLHAFSHVFHLVSKVVGQLKPDEHALSALSASFPAGTLVGAPKPMAMKIISDLEHSKREYYGGAIGIIENDQNLNMAIVIRSVMVQNGCLNYRAGAGVVADSIPEKEYQEIQHKLRVVRSAIQESCAQHQINNRNHERYSY